MRLIDVQEDGRNLRDFEKLVRSRQQVIPPQVPIHCMERNTTKRQFLQVVFPIPDNGRVLRSKVDAWRSGPERSLRVYVHQNHFPHRHWNQYCTIPKQKTEKRPISLKHNTDELVNLPHRYRGVQRTAERDSTQGFRNRSMQLSHSFQVFMLGMLILFSSEREFDPQLTPKVSVAHLWLWSRWWPVHTQRTCFESVSALIKDAAIHVFTLGVKGRR